MTKAMHQARDGRLHILKEMENALVTPREDLKAHVPRITSFKIDPDKIGALIGPGERTLRKFKKTLKLILILMKTELLRFLETTKKWSISVLFFVS